MAFRPSQENSALGNGAHVTAGGTWINGSRRLFKENFSTVNAAVILKKLAQLEIGTWQYIGSDEGYHLGPIAEEFYEAFGLGKDQQYISTVDADGVALAAIQALHEENQQQKSNSKYMRIGLV